MSTPAPSSEPAVQVAARLLAEGRPGDAAARLATLVAEAPTYAAAHVLRATALEAAGRIDEAVVSWGRAAALVPGSPLVHRERERLLAMQVADEAPAGLPPAEAAAPPPFPFEDVAREDDVAETAAAEPATDETPADEAAIEDAADPLVAPPLPEPDDEDAALGPEADEEVDGPLLDFGLPTPPPTVEAEPAADEPPVADEPPFEDEPPIEATSAAEPPAGGPSGGEASDYDYTAPRSLDLSGLVFGDPPSPEPAAPEPPAAEPPAGDAPAYDYSAPRGLDASGLVFGDPPPPAETDDLPPIEVPPPFTPSPDAPDAEADETGTDESSGLPGGAPTEAAAPTPAEIDWVPDETGIAPVLPPEGALGTPPERPLPATLPNAADAETADDDDDVGDGDGWNVLSEADVPSPPPGTYAEPDVVPPEDPAPMPLDDDPFADIDAVVDEFASPGDAFGDAPPADGLSVADELDALISQLEDAPRIRPDPEYTGPEVSLDHGEVDDMVSETLAKIYAAQHQYVEAALVYEKLAARQPDQADELLERAAELRQRGG